MAASEPSSFPDETGADIFVREYATAVVPADRDYLSSRPPLLILSVPPYEAEGAQGYAETTRGRVRRVLDALRGPLDRGGKRVPYALLDADFDSDTELLAELAGEELGTGVPARMTPDRLPDFWLLRDVITHIMKHPGNQAELEAEALREHAYARRARQHGLPRLLWDLGGKQPVDGGGLKSWLVTSLWHSVTRTFPRWWWARRKTRQLIRPGRLPHARRRGWLGRMVHKHGGTEDLFQVLHGLATRQSPRLAPGAHHERRDEALDAFEALLLRALLEDLSAPAVGRRLPKRRRRTARPVLLVELPPEGADGARRAERFLRTFREVSADVRGPGPLIVAVGQPSPALLAELDTEEGDLRRADFVLRQRSAPAAVRMHLAEAAFSGPGLPLERPVLPRFRIGWRTQTATVASGSLLAVAVTGWGGYAVVTDGEGPAACVGGDVAVAAPGRTDQFELDPAALYESARAEIEEQNKRARLFARGEGARTVRTVVHFGSDEPTGETDTLFDGTIPELRGIAMWQKQLNDEAASDDRRVPLVVDVRSTGTGFENAEEKAVELVDELRERNAEGKSKDYEQVVGVLGFAQSKEETRQALRVLDEAEIPVVGTTATADEMQVGEAYWPTTPSNSTEAKIAASFATASGIIARKGAPQECDSARHAVVILSPEDLYSKSLAGMFEREFQGATKAINFAQDGAFADAAPGTARVSDAHSLTDQVCKALAGEPRTVVYWSARARDFTAFVNAFNAQGTCTQDDLTVLGGNELTNVSLTGEYHDKHWLRLYHSAHRLPADDERSSDKTRQFITEYDDFVGYPKTPDAWRQDGHSAVAYDAFHVLSRATDLALSGHGEVEHSAMLTALRHGIEFNGATGYVAYDPGNNMPPPDKTLVFLRQSADGPKTVAACGRYRQDVQPARQDPPCTP